MVHLWVTRWREAGAMERATLACLEDRPSRPGTSPNQVPDGEAERICERRRRTGWSPRRLADAPDISRPHSTIHRVLRRGGCSRPPRPKRPAVVRYEWPCPGQLLHMDVKKLGRFERPGHALTADRTRRSRGAGFEYVHSVVDDCSRLAYSEIHDDERAPTVTAFTRRAPRLFLDQGIVCERLMTDNAVAYTQNRSLRELLAGRAIRHIRTRAPTRRGPTARWSASTRPSNASGPTRSTTPQATRGEALPHWIANYNQRRTHTALGNRRPRARVRDVLGPDS
jgi:hypothetical protein